MSLLIDVQEVPWRILEMVQARILANRARKDQRQQDEEVRGLTRPRPQRKAFGATMTTYRRPEPVGLPADAAEKIAVAMWRVESISPQPGSLTERITVRNASNTASATFDVNHPEIALSPLWPGTSCLSGNLDQYACYDTTFTGIENEGWVDRWQIYGRWQIDSDSFHLALPAGGQNCIYVYGNRSNQSGYYAKYQKTYSGGLDPSLLTLTREKGIYTTPEVKVLKCFLISNRTIRELAPPAGLRESIESLREAFTERGTQQEVINVPQLGQLDRENANLVDRSYVVGGIRDALNEIPLLYSYGLSRSFGLVLGSNSGDGTGLFTPGVYTFLSSYRGDPPSNSNSYATVRSTYLGSAPVSPKLLAPCMIEGGCPVPGTRTQERPSNSNEPAFITFDSTRNIPTVRTAPLDASGFKREARRLDLIDVDLSEYNPIYAWDWGNPAYCRQQLLALGFSPADLTP